MLKISLTIFFLCTSTLSFVTMGHAASSALTLYQTFENIGYIAEIGGNDTTATVSYKDCGSDETCDNGDDGGYYTISSSSTNPPVYIDRRSSVGGQSNPFANTVRGSIFELTSGRRYKVKVVFDTSATITGEVEMWDHDSVAPTGNTYYVDNDGNNNNAGGSCGSGNAWGSIDYGYSQLSPNDVLKICPGTYQEDLHFDRDGSATTPGKAAGSNYFFVTAADKYNIPVIKGRAYLTGDYNHISYIAVNASGSSGTGLWSIKDSNFSVLDHITKVQDGFQHTGGSMTGLLIDNANVDLQTSNSSSTTHYDTGLHLQSGSYPTRIVVRNGVWKGGRDALTGGYGNNSTSGGPSHSDFHNNDISDWGDDGLESEGGNVCVRIYNNHLHEGQNRLNGYSAFAIGATYYGPLYIFNNVADLYNKDVDDLFKTGNASNDASGSVYIMNNALFGDVAGITNSAGGSGQQNIWAYNNAWKITREYLRLNDSNRGGDKFDYNNWDANGNQEWEVGQLHKSFSSWQSGTGHDSNGMSVESDFYPNFKLKGSSNLIDKALPIDLFRKDKAGNIRGGFWDIGPYEYNSQEEWLDSPRNLRAVPPSE